MADYLKLSKHKINKDIHDHINEINKEFRAGFDELKKHPKSVTIYGSSRSTPASPHYRQAEELASRIVKELNYSVVTGGGPGVMAAANLGAQEAHGNSVGFTISLPHEQHTNPYITSTTPLNYFFIRKALLTFAAEAFVFFPGGYGTMDELFGALTLIQTYKIPRVPVILFGKDFWNSFRDFLKNHLLEKHHTIDHNDMELFTITDNIDEVIKIIQNSTISNWWEKEFD